MEVLYGVHPVAEALKAGRRRFDHVIVAAERHDERLARLVADCKLAGVRVRQEPREQLTHLAGTIAHARALSPSSASRSPCHRGSFHRSRSIAKASSPRARRRGRPAESRRASPRRRRGWRRRCRAYRAPRRTLKPCRRQGQRRSIRTPAHRPRRQPRASFAGVERTEHLGHRPR